MYMGDSINFFDRICGLVRFLVGSGCVIISIGFCICIRCVYLFFNTTHVLLIKKIKINKGMGLMQVLVK